jgi:cell division protein FtsL
LHLPQKSGSEPPHFPSDDTGPGGTVDQRAGPQRSFAGGRTDLVSQRIKQPWQIELEIEMTDWADGIETRNYGIKCVIDARMLSEFVRTIVCLALVAGALLFYLWVRSQIINIGYESQKLFAAEEDLLRTQQNLRLEEESLTRPERIDDIARNQLGMIPLSPTQLILPQIQDVEKSIPDKLAMAVSDTTGLKKSAAKKPGNYTN